MKIVLVAAAATAIALSFAGVRTLMPSVSVAQASEARAQPAQVAPSPAVVVPTTQLGCADAVLCVGDCKKGDASCVAECESVLSHGAALYHALMTCAEEHACNGDGLCARKNCDAQLNACIGASAAEGGCR